MPLSQGDRDRKRDERIRVAVEESERREKARAGEDDESLSTEEIVNRIRNGGRS